MDPYPTDQQEAGEPPLPDRARAAVDPLLRAAVRTLPEATGAFCAELLGRARPGRSVGPALVLAAARAVGGLEEDALTAAASIELVYVMGLLYEDTAGLDPSARPSAPPAAGRAGEALAALAIRLVAGRSAAVGVLCDCLVERSEAGDEAAGRGALFAAACALGGVHGGAPPRITAALSAFGRA
ncbi:polyprenyl synthetase family protein, partial [Streptomyces sp. NPDC059981]